MERMKIVPPSGIYNVVCGYKIYQIQSVLTDDLLKISLLSYPLLKILEYPIPQIQSKIMWYCFLVSLKNKYFETHKYIYISLNTKIVYIEISIFLNFSMHFTLCERLKLLKPLETPEIKFVCMFYLVTRIFFVPKLKRSCKAVHHLFLSHSRFPIIFTRF